MTTRKLFERLESFASALIEPRHQEDSPKSGEGGLGWESTLEFLLCGLLRAEPSTSSYWCDGVVVADVECCGNRLELRDAFAWIGDHASMWKVPAVVSMELYRDLAELQFVNIRLGDASNETLKGHHGTKPRTPHVWLHEFKVTRPPPDDTYEVLAGKIAEWLQQNPEGRVFAPNWEPLTLAEAKAVLVSLAAEESLVDLVPTWLDGSPALHICVSS